MMRTANITIYHNKIPQRKRGREGGRGDKNTTETDSFIGTVVDCGGLDYLVAILDLC